MNKVILMGRLTRDPDVRYSNGEQATAVARFTLAVDRRVARRDGEQTADFIGCVAFGRTAEFVEKYFRQGMRSHPDRKLHQSRWTESVYHRCGCRRSRVCREQSYQRCISQQQRNGWWISAAGTVCAESFRSSRRWFYEHSGWH